MFDEAIRTGDLDRLERYDALDQWFSIGLVVSLVGASLAWVVWQYQLARATHPDALRRGPGWHVGSWFVPIVSLWFPFQNVKDLWVRYLPDRPTAVLGWWWGFFLVTQMSYQAYGDAYERAETVDAIKNAALIGCASASATIVAGVLALTVHRALHDAAIRQAASPVA